MVTSSRCGSSFPRQFWERMQNLYITYSAKNSCLEPQQLSAVVCLRQQTLQLTLQRSTA